MRSFCLRCVRWVGLIFSVLLLAVVVPAQEAPAVPALQGHIFDRLRQLHRMPEPPVVEPPVVAPTASAEETPQAEPGAVAGSYARTILYDFCAVDKPTCTDGADPNAGLIMDSEGNLYGTTFHGGSGLGGGGGYGGTIFKYDLATKKETVLYSYCSTTGCPNGAGPSPNLIQDADGNFYDTTSDGAANGWGDVFKLPTSDVQQILYSFCPTPFCPDGSAPEAGLIRDDAGNLYGTTVDGGAGSLPEGTVFEVFAAGGEKVLHSFCTDMTAADICLDGSAPLSNLIRDTEGNLFGTTLGGGAANQGVLFSVDTSDIETVLYNFCSLKNCTDGAGPTGSPIRDAAGNFYGTTEYGGANNKGTVFEYNPTTHKETVLYSFCALAGCADGQSPVGNLIFDAEGNLYGATNLGGTGTYTLGEATGGTVFKLVPATKKLTVLYSFCTLANCADGQTPTGSLLMDAAGDLYGTTEGGGHYQYGGVLFKLTAPKPQTITFPNPGTQKYGAVITLKATASSKLAVTYKIVSGPAKLSASKLTVTGIGTVKVEALQAGNTVYLAATPVTVTFTTEKAVLTVKATNASRAYGAANPILHYTITGFVNGDKSTVVTGKATPTTTATAKSPVGTYPITFSTETLTATNYSITYVDGELSVGKAELTVTATSLSKVAGTAIRRSPTPSRASRTATQARWLRARLRW